MPCFKMFYPKEFQQVSHVCIHLRINAGDNGKVRFEWHFKGHFSYISLKVAAKKILKNGGDTHPASSFGVPNGPVFQW